MVPFIPDHEAILLANHGAISFGENLLDAFMKMETVEHLAQVSLVAHQLGSATPMSVQQVAELYVAKAKYLHNAIPVALSPDRRNISTPPDLPERDLPTQERTLS